jgi:hypothetical protein
MAKGWIRTCPLRSARCVFGCACRALMAVVDMFLCVCVCARVNVRVRSFSCVHKAMCLCVSVRMRVRAARGVLCRASRALSPSASAVCACVCVRVGGQVTTQSVLHLRRGVGVDEGEWDDVGAVVAAVEGKGGPRAPETDIRFFRS